MKRGSGHIRCGILILVMVGMLATTQRWLVQTAFAHGDVARAQPAPDSVLEDPPEQVVIWFTEPIEPDFSEIQVLNAQGERVDNGDSRVDSRAPTALSVTLGALSNGTYTVAWKNVSTIDGHTVRGSFVFSVGEPINQALKSGSQSQPILQSPIEPVVRWLVLLSALALVGGLGFEDLVLRPALTGKRSNKALRRLGRRLGSRTLKLIWIAIGLFLVASVGQLVVQTAISFEIPLSRTVGSPLVIVLSRTGWGHLWLSRIRWLLTTAVALGLLVTILPRNQAGGGSRVESYHKLFRAVALWAAAGVLLSISQASHAAATAEVRAEAIFTDFLHLLAAGFWVGGLFHFALTAPVIMQTVSGAKRRELLANLVPRFSTLAALSVGTLIITGLYSTWAQVTILPALTTTPYGLTLLAKVGLIVPLLLLGAANLLWVSPRLVQNDRMGQRLRRLVAGEAILAGLVLLTVGLLTSLEPARQVASREGLGQPKHLAFHDAVEGLDVTLGVEPGQVGPNTFWVTLKDRRGEPVTNASEVRLRLRYLDTDLGDSSVPAVAEEAGRYVVKDGLLSVAGAWQADLAVRRPDTFDARTAFRFEVAPGGPASSAAIAPDQRTGRLLWGAELILLGVLFLAAGIPRRGWRGRPGVALMGSGGVAVVAGLFLILNTQLGGAGAEAAPRNPFPPNAASLEVGRQVYEQNCLSCHGATGRGDGPAGKALNPPPADLVVHVPLHPEVDLFRLISFGVPGTAMPPMEERLTEDDIWHVINYIQTFVAEE